MTLLVRSSDSSVSRTSTSTAQQAARPSAPAPAPAPTPPVSSFKAAATKDATSLSQRGLDLIKGFEGLRLTAYRDAVGVWTIGYGHTGRDVKPGMRISQARAEQLLRADTGWAQRAVRDQVKVPLTQGQFDALTSFTFNLGAGALAKSTLLKKLNAGDYAGAQKEFGKWVHAGGQVLQGLVRRRAAEAKLFGNRGPGGVKPQDPTRPPSRPPKTTDYRVRAGDTFSGIAAKNRMSVSELKALNPQVRDINKIYVGQMIHLRARKAARPTTGTYTVRSGDTMSGIAAKHHMTLGALAKLNPQVRDLNRISVGQKINVKARASAPSTPSTPSQPSQPSTPSNGPKAVLNKGLPNTSGLSAARRYQLYADYVNQYGDAQAKRDLAAGKRVVLGLRQDTPMTANMPYRGTYDDRMVVLWKDGSGPHVVELAANTEPNRRWSIPANQSSKPVGRLMDGQTVRYHKAWSTKFGNHLQPYGNPWAQRDADRDYRFEKGEKSYNGEWGGQLMYIHRAWAGDTGSQGCQTIEESRFNTFWSSLGSQKDFSYVLLNVTKR